MKTKYSPTGESWGLLASLDVHGCSDKVKDKEAIRAYFIQLCDEVIRMKRFGPCHVEYFGDPGIGLEGYSAFQFIQTSCVSGHFSDTDDSAYIDVFSCADFDPEEVAKFTVAYFDAEDCSVSVTVRMYGDKNAPHE